MKTVAAFILINTIIVVANLIAAVVIVAVAPLIRATVPDSDTQWWPWAMLTVIATAMALNVMKAATEAS